MFRRFARTIIPTLLVCALSVGMSEGKERMQVPEKLSPPVEEGIWIRPSKEWPAVPVVGFKDGIRIALWPGGRGPRGVIRVLAPHICPGVEDQKINFIAVEPVVGESRGYSELEHSKLDDRRGLRMWFSDSRSDAPTPCLPWNPSRGKTGRIRQNGKQIETLTIVLNIESFENKAQPVMEVTFRADRPDEVGFRSYSAKDGAPMSECVLTSTMGNFSRCRLLWLKDGVLDSRKIWPKCKDWDFVWTDDIPAERIYRDKDGTLTAAITPSEASLESDKIPHDFWQFKGKIATQYWRKYPGTVTSNLRIRVNGRAFYYGTPTPIPGGVAFENFELIEDFRPGIESSFGVTLKRPREMGWK